MSFPGELPNGLAANGLDAPKALIPGDTVLDIGAGLRPMGWYKPTQHWCVEPHGPYADRLAAAGYPTLRVTAREALQPDARWDAIYMLDVIEHMERHVGEDLLLRALELRPKQIVVFTPNGFLPQSHDAWNLGAEHWQTHRSGWVPADFPGWEIEHHPANAFFATWTRP